MHDPHGTPAKFVGTVVGSMFACIGIAVIVFLWGSSGPMGPPVFFKIFGSCVAICFVAIGGSLAYASVTGKSQQSRLGQRFGIRPRSQASDSQSRTDSAPDFGCPNCGSGLAADTEISPSGDVKCPYCKQWFSTR